MLTLRLSSSEHEFALSGVSALIPVQSGIEAIGCCGEVPVLAATREGRCTALDSRGPVLSYLLPGQRQLERRIERGKVTLRQGSAGRVRPVPAPAPPPGGRCRPSS